MVMVHLQEEIVDNVVGQVALLTELGEDLEHALNRVREAFIDSVEVACLVALFVHEHAKREQNTAG